MAEVWKRPLLTAFEVGWRWLFWSVFLGSLAWRWWPELSPTIAAVQANGLSSFGYLRSTYISLSAQTGHTAVPPLFLLCMGAIFAWIALSAWAKGKLLQRLYPDARVGFAGLAAISALRVFCFIAVLAVWLKSVTALTQRMVLSPQAGGGEAPLVPYAALLICGTLLLFVFWMAGSYLFQLAPVDAVGSNKGPWVSLRYSLRGGVLRSKLIEINLVIGIVKIALLVLALVFSACPLPFSSVETQSFLTCWWVGVGVWYAVASDYVHVVRTVAFLRMWQVYENLPGKGIVVTELAS